MQVPEYRDFYRRRLDERAKFGKFLAVGSSPDSEFGATDAALDLLSVRYLIVSDAMSGYAEGVAREHELVFHDDGAAVSVYENTGAFPRAYLSPALVRTAAIGAERPRWQMDRTFTDDDEMLLEALEVGIPRTEGSAADAGEAVIVQDDNTVVRVEVDAAQPSVLVLGDVYHDNWQVSIDGEPAHMARVNDVVRGVVVPAGESTVVFHYESTPRRVGLVISFVSLTALLVVSVAWAVRRRRRAAVGDPEPAPVG
jgi:hypothetical protein